jgi:hypothetical protein
MCLVLLVGFLLRLLFDPENEGSTLLKTLMDFYWSSQCYISEDCVHHSHCCENFRTNNDGLLLYVIDKSFLYVNSLCGGHVCLCLRLFLILYVDGSSNLIY